MSFSLGIVGLPNVGKSTLFKALTKKAVNIANYPFCTIEPNKGIVEVPDERLKQLAQLSHSKKIVPAVIEFVDIAGLVRGAHRGEGLGNKFLSHIREVDAICQVVRHFASGDIIHVDGKEDPQRDIEVINMELALADMEVLSKHLPKLKDKLKNVKANEEKAQRALVEFLETKIKLALEQGTQLRQLGLSAAEQEAIRYLNFLTLKPMIYIMNVGEKEIQLPIQSPYLQNEVVIPVCAQLEAELTELPVEEIPAYLKEVGIEMSGLDRVIAESYKILDLVSFLTTGEDESRAWTITRGMKAPQAAGKIHTDFEKNFIAVEVIPWQDLVAAGSEAAAKEKGLMRLEGREYVIKDGEVCNFRVNV